MKLAQVTRVFNDIPVLLIASKDDVKVSGTVQTTSARTHGLVRGTIETYSTLVGEVIDNLNHVTLEDGTVLKLVNKGTKVFSYDLCLFYCEFETRLLDLGCNWLPSTVH